MTLLGIFCLVVSALIAAFHGVPRTSPYPPWTLSASILFLCAAVALFRFGPMLLR